MDIQQPIVNKVAQSGLITLNLEDFLPKDPIVALDIKPFLFRELLLKEKDFRKAMKEQDWTQYEGKNLAVFCSSDAIIPMWAYMLIATYAESHASFVGFGDKNEILRLLTHQNIHQHLDVEGLKEKRVILKGCGEKPIPASAYLEVSRLLKPVVLSLMYGEACSTVPIYKIRKQKEKTRT